MSFVPEYVRGVEITDLQTHRSEEPVSKSRLSVTPGVPILTGTTYSRLTDGENMFSHRHWALQEEQALTLNK